MIEHWHQRSKFSHKMELNGHTERDRNIWTTWICTIFKGIRKFCLFSQHCVSFKREDFVIDCLYVLYILEVSRLIADTKTKAKAKTSFLEKVFYQDCSLIPPYLKDRGFWGPLKIVQIQARGDSKRPCFDQLYTHIFNLHILERQQNSKCSKMCAFSWSKHGRSQSPLGSKFLHKCINLLII